MESGRTAADEGAAMAEQASGSAFRGDAIAARRFGAQQNLNSSKRREMKCERKLKGRTRPQPSTFCIIVTDKDPTSIFTTDDLFQTVLSLQLS